MPGYCTATARGQPPGLRLGADPAGWLEAGWTFPADWPRTGLRGRGGYHYFRFAEYEW